jgi:aspartate kinase
LSLLLKNEVTRSTFDIYPGKRRGLIESGRMLTLGGTEFTMFPGLGPVNKNRVAGMGKIKIGGIIQSKKLAQVGVMSAPDQPGSAGKILGALGQEGINIEFIVQFSELGRGNVIFCLNEKDLPGALNVLDTFRASIGYERVVHHSPVAIISVFGPHFREKPAIAGTMFGALGNSGINILAISTSISTLSCVIEESLLPEAVKAVSEAFDLP